MRVVGCLSNVLEQRKTLSLSKDAGVSEGKITGNLFCCLFLWGGVMDFGEIMTAK